MTNIGQHDAKITDVVGNVVHKIAAPIAHKADPLLIVNHPMTCNRYGFPGHLPPWNTMFA